MIFAEHGVFEVKIEDNILIVDATGPFNEELIVRYQKSLDVCIKNIQSANWNQVVTLHKFSLFTPEAEQKLIETLKHRKSSGLVACAVILKDIDGETLIRTQMKRCYKSASIVYTFTNSIDDAKKWLNGLTA